MIPDAECLKIMCEILSSLQIGNFLVKVRAGWDWGGSRLGLAPSEISSQWDRDNWELCKMNRFLLPHTLLLTGK